jgi:hypothetical protein
VNDNDDNIEEMFEWGSGNYIVKAFQHLTDAEKAQFFRFLKSQSQETAQPAHENMWDDEWENKPGTVPYLLTKTGDFIKNNGEMFVVVNRNTLRMIGMGGISRSHFNEHVALAGIRTWIHKSMRNRALPREYLLPRQKRWAEKRDCKIVALTFNEYNKNIIQIFKRSRLAEPLDKTQARLPRHLFYNGLEEVPFPVKIMGTKQYVIYEKLDPTWDFDWESIRWTE